MKYITLKDLSETIRKNIWKIPRDIDFIIGVPRSGMIAASIISSFLNMPLIDVNSYIHGLEPYGGHRLRHSNRNHKKTGKALVIDDTVWNGTAMRDVRAKLDGHKETKFIYMCIYLEGRAHDLVDLYLEDVRKYTNNFTTIVYYEWNIFQHNEVHTSKYLCDIDGFLCVDPPDERRESDYLRYISHATPLFLPQTKIGCLITYRLEKNREITEKWLEENGVRYDRLVMFDANTWHERKNSGISPEAFKSIFYTKHDEFDLFIESDQKQAMRIAEFTKKPVYCVETNCIFQ